MCKQSVPGQGKRSHIEVATAATISLLCEDIKQHVQSVSSIVTATGRQTTRATRGAGAGCIETTLICNLMNLK